ncbi:Sulfite oxidase [Candidatus Burkholderia verschuerenii]|uniref:Sulfite oxidase n=2 Tax=Candidatus Burkholderia verschuerenii TaxID=242163 RepID=A0A0L0M6X5_9BURK|nr:Sulfite oxidase [Candidatus Burkholderia verschuerenii]
MMVVTLNNKTPYFEKKPSSLRYFQEGPAPIDVDSWRLTICGEVSREIALSYDDLLSLPTTSAHRRNVCVCLWSIKRYWEGVLLRDVLALAGVEVEDPALYIRQLSHGTEKGVYDSTVHLKSAIEHDALLALRVDGEQLPLENGFPLRFIDFGLYLYKCVKALGRIEVTRENKIGFWEDYAGYSLDGTIQPKRYYAVDLQKKFYFDGVGEVLDSDLTT